MKKRFIYFGSSLFVCVLILVFLSVSDGCSKSSSNNPPGSVTKDVAIQNTAFSLTSITISVNTTVKWTNNDPFNHTVTSDAGLFDSGNIVSGGNYSHKFTSTGTFPYHCTIHSIMTATVIVQ